MHTGFFQAVVRMRQGHSILRVLCPQQLGLRFLQAGIALQHERGGGRFTLGHVLGHLGDSPTRGMHAFAPVLVQLPQQQRHQRGLANAVGAHQPDLFTRMDGDVGAFKQHLGAAAQLHISQDDHDNATRSAARSKATWVSPAEVSSHHGVSEGKARSK